MITPLPDQRLLQGRGPGIPGIRTTIDSGDQEAGLAQRGNAPSPAGSAGRRPSAGHRENGDDREQQRIERAVDQTQPDQLQRQVAARESRRRGLPGNGPGQEPARGIGTSQRPRPRGGVSRSCLCDLRQDALKKEGDRARRRVPRTPAPRHHARGGADPRRARK